MPCLNSSGKLASDSSSSPSARNPFQVKAKVTHRLPDASDDCTSAAAPTWSRTPPSHARPDAGFRNDRKTYSPASAGVRVSSMCWMSSNSSVSGTTLLHLVEHGRERVLEPQRLLDLVRGHIRVLGVLQKARPLVLPHELDERGCVRLPVFGKPFQVLEHRIDPVLGKQGHRILGVLVEVGVENPLVHEVRIGPDVEEHPAQVMQPEDGEPIGESGDRFLDLLPDR